MFSLKVLQFTQAKYTDVGCVHWLFTLQLTSPFAKAPVVVQLLSHVHFFVTSWTAARQVSLSFTIFRSLLKLMYIMSVMPSKHLIFYRPFSSCPQSFPAAGSFPMSQPFPSHRQNIGASASASVLPMNIQGWYPLGLTGLISLVSKGKELCGRI